MMKLIQLYEGVALGLGMTFDGEGRLSAPGGDGGWIPATIEGKRLIIPYREVLRNPDWNAYVAFHPLSENVMRGESQVLKTIRILANMRLTQIIGTLMQQLMELAADTDAHDKLTIDQTKFLKLVPDADKKTCEILSKILRVVDPTNPERRMINIYLKRGGELDGRKYSRLARVSFPFLEQIDEDAKTIMGVGGLRKKDMASIRAVFEYIIPHALDITEYSSGNQSMAAPYFDSLMRAFAKVSHQTNTIVKKFKKHLADADELMVNLDWYDLMDELPKLHDMIPSLDGNDGVLLTEEKEDEAPASPKSLAPASPSPSSTMTHTPAPSPASSGGGSTLSPPISGGFDPYAGLPKLGQPLQNSNAPVRRPLAAAVANQEDDWEAFVASRAAPQYPVFNAVGGQPGGWGGGSGWGQPQMQTGFAAWNNSVPPTPGFGSASPYPTFRAKGENPQTGQSRGGGWPEQGTISSV